MFDFDVIFVLLFRIYVFVFEFFFIDLTLIHHYNIFIALTIASRSQNSIYLKSERKGKKKRLGYTHSTL